MHLTLQLVIQLTVQSRKHLEALKEAPKDALSELHKDAQENAFEVTRKRETEVAPELHRWLHLFMESLMRKFVQNV